jgi:hypothetical protein
MCTQASLFIIIFILNVYSADGQKILQQELLIVEQPALKRAVVYRDLEMKRKEVI